MLALQQLRHTAHEINHFQAPLDITAGILQQLAMFAGQQRRQGTHMLFDQRFEPEQHLGDLRRWGLVAPSPPGLRRRARP